MTAIHFPTRLDIPPGDWPGKNPYERKEKYTVGTGRVGNSMAVYVYDGFRHPYYKLIPLKWRFYHLASPAERIRKATAKAEGIAKKLNHQELYLNHEAEISGRQL